MAIQMYAPYGDLKKLQRVAIEHGIIADFKELAIAWEKYSKQADAGWLYLPEDNECIWDAICDNIKIEEY